MEGSPSTTGDTGDLLPAGTYDWIEILGSTASGICLVPGGVCNPDEISPADGEEWSLALFGDSTWITDGSLIPDDLPALHTALVVGFEFDASGNEIGSFFATATLVPEPTVLALLGLCGSFAGLRAMRRRS